MSIARNSSSLLILAALLALTPLPALATQNNSSILLEGRVEQRTPEEQTIDDGLDTRQLEETESTESTVTLSGNASAERELQSVAWDSWRNRVAKAFWRKFYEKMSGGDAIVIGNRAIKLGNAPIIRFPVGTEVTYACDITRDRRIVNARIVTSSGNYQMNSMMLTIISRFDGKKLLAFPEGSQRNVVTLSNRLSISPTPGFTPSNLNDVERY